MSQPGPYIYYGVDVSYFSGKFRPALPQKGLWYRETLPDFRAIKDKTGMYFIPVLVTPEGEAWQDTGDMLDKLEAAHPEPPLFPTTPVQRVVAYLMEVYGAETGLLPAMHYRWSFEESADKARHDFALTTGNRDVANKFAERMASMLPVLGVSEQSGPAIEAHLAELLSALCAHFREHRFLLGDSMSLADCGLMGPMYGHLFRDAVPRRVLYDTAFEVTYWIDRMNRPPMDQQGWVADDGLPATLRDVLRVAADGVPMLLAELGALDAWADEHAEAGATPPRGVAVAESTFRDAEVNIGVRPHTLYMVQRPLDAYAALSTDERATVDAALAGTGWEALLAHAPRHRLTKKRNELVWE